MRDLNYDLKNLCQRFPEGSYATRAQRQHILQLSANHLHELGYRKLRADGFKGRHVNALLQRWKEENLSPATLKNRMTVLRWWAQKIGKPALIANSNDHYGIPSRKLVAETSKAIQLHESQLAKVTDPYVKLSLKLQREFGLRREEAIKFRPAYAIREDRIVLKPSWCKGGRGREVPIRTESQRQVLKEARRLAGKGSLIPYDKRYVQQVKVYERQCKQAGLSKVHGLRHAYAQRRYEEITGWKAPAVGGPSSCQLTLEQREIDHQARLVISREMGHEREQITAVYLGR